MKNKSVCIITVLMCVSIALNIFQFVKYFNISNELKATYVNIDNTYEYMDSLTVSSFEKKVSDGDKIFAYIGRVGCGDCTIFGPILKETIQEYNLESVFQYVNVQQYREEDSKRWENFKNKYGFTQTPALLIFDKGVLTDMVEWDSNGLSQKKLVEWLKKNEIIR